MSEDRQKRATEWCLYLHGEQPLPPAKLINARHHSPPKTKAKAQPQQDPGRRLYSTGLSAEEGPWHRAGWAGRI
jgi:hypothetical protein